MKALVLCEETIEEIYDKKIFEIFDPKECIIITTENNLFHQIRKLHPCWRCEHIYLLHGDKNFNHAKQISEQILKEIVESLKDKKTRSLAKISINSIYEIYARIIVGVEKQILCIIDQYEIKDIYFFGGNTKVPFFPLNMAEGERPFRFCYKRSWFLNPVIFGLFSDIVNIHWKQEFFLKLMLFRELRIIILNAGKIYKTYKKCKKTEKIKRKKHAQSIGIVVRTLNQLNSIQSIYKAIDVKKNYEPILLAYENYSNTELIETIHKEGYNYVNIRQNITITDILSCYFGTKTSSKKNLHIYKGINIDRHYLSKEMKVQWWDAALLIRSFAKTMALEHINIKGVINIETFNWVAEAQVMWAKEHMLPIYSVQFVTLEKRPNMILSDKYFFMTLNEKAKYREYIQENKCGYVGPVCYDNVFNSSKHSIGVLKQAVIFTQPDSFRKDSIKIINDVLKIRDELDLDMNIIIKLHPRENDVEYFKNEYEHGSRVRVIFDEINSVDVLMNSDLAIGIVSTTLYQSVIIGTPAISINYDNLTNYKMDIIESGVVKKLINYEEILDYLAHFSQYESIFYKVRENYIKNSLGNYNGKGAEELANQIEKSIFKRQTML